MQYLLCPQCKFRVPASKHICTTCGFHLPLPSKVRAVSDQLGSHPASKTTFWQQLLGMNSVQQEHGQEAEEPALS